MKKSPQKNSKSGGDLTVSVTPAGPSSEALSEAGRRASASASVQKLLRRTQHRLLHVKLLGEEQDGDLKPKRPGLGNRFRATYFDYTNNRVIHADGSLAHPEKAIAREHGLSPLPTQDEFDAAVAILRKKSSFAEMLEPASTLVYPPMPPLIHHEQLDGRSERVVAVGLLPREGKGRHEIVGVNLNRGEIHRYEHNAPATALAGDSVCGVPAAGQPTVKHAAGQVWVTIKQNNTVLWKFLVVRPAASSGTNGSGVELRYVD